MPVPFLNKHSEKQYLELETHYFNLHSFLQSLLTITEGEHLNSDSQRLNHFNALCARINEGVDRFSKITKQVRDSQFKGDSATTSSHPESAEVVIYCSKEERELMIEALEHIGISFPDLKKADEFHDLAKDLINSRR